MYEIFQGHDKQWYWHLKSANHERIEQGEGYSTKAACLKGIEAVRNYAQTSLVLDLSSKDVQGKPAMINLDARRK